ncbi:uncharacterized protein B0T15DRAFT_576861 [Chaetomium strumarium]|uniref:Uncharacterized protein n=1 Tax=Chaetomium strumarium TaxID=1170767 RepID=A0AAJ0GP30_9PEZI|nr:hypothetical protein B0T15DRAFT_576861 [Chaetomium strumarium]
MPSAISIQAVSVYGETGVLAEPLGYFVEAQGHEPGGSHVISAQLVASLSGYELRVIQKWAKTGEHFIRLDWTFPGHTYPKFTTRHTLDSGEASGDVSFSGGLDWAQRMLNVTQALQLPRHAASFHAAEGGQHPPMPSSVFTGDSPKLPFQTLHPPHPYWNTSATFLNTLIHKAPKDADDEASVYSEPTSARTISDTDASCPSSDLASTRQPSPSSESLPLPLQEWTEDDLVQHQLRIDMLHRQRRDAEAMYAHNGDTSGLVAVMASASQSMANWDSSGMPRF